MRSKKAVYNIISNLILQIFVVIYGFIVPKVIISNYGSDVNGLVSSITHFLTYITLLQSGFGPVVKSSLYKPLADKDKEKIESILKTTERFFRTIAIIFLVYIVLLSIFYPLLVNNSFEYFFTLSLVIIISISIFAEYYFGITYSLFLQAKQESYVMSIIQIITYIISVVVILVLAKLNVSIQTIKLASSVIFVLRPLLQNLYVKKKYKINLQNVKKEYKIEQKWNGLSQHIAFVIHNNTDVTLLTLFSSLANVSIYTVYNSVTSGIKNLIRSISSGVDSTFGDIIAQREHENLSKKFDMYETIYLLMSSVFYSCTIILIVPFISIYTKGITDANYINYPFGYLLAICALLLTIKSLYNEISNVAGHFKEMRTGAILEAIINIVSSVLLVFKYGLIGVAVGTILSVLVRVISLIIHVNKKIIKRSIKTTLYKLLMVVINIMITIIVSNYLPLLANINYLNWLVNAIIIFIESCIITFIVSIIFFKKDLIVFLNVLKNLVKKKGKKK